MKDLQKNAVVLSKAFFSSRNGILIIFILISFSSCKKEKEILYTESDRSIQITDGISIDNGVTVKDTIFNLLKYDRFLKYLTTSDHFLVVQLKDFKNTTSSNKVVLALRYDIDDNINAAVKFAYREHKYGIRSTYFILHTAVYYGENLGPNFVRNDKIIYYLKKIQDAYDHEIGFHNDLVTLQVVYNVSPKEYLKNELLYLRGNNIRIWGTTYHGSPYCYIYQYYNAYFWKGYTYMGWNYEYITKDNKTIEIEKDNLENYDLTYEAGQLDEDYFFADCFFINGKRWNMSMVNLDTIKPGKKVIILLHPEHWD